VHAVELQVDVLYTTPLGNDRVNRVDDDIASGQHAFVWVTKASRRTLAGG
jgi:hypothetical protein